MTRPSHGEPAHREPSGPLFEPHAPRPSNSPRADVRVRRAERRDVGAIVEIWIDRNGGDEEDLLRRWHRSFDEPNPEVLTFSAEVDGELVGYAKANVFHPPEDAPANCAPAGWYLTGVSVARHMRRRGAGLALTRARLECLRGVTAEVFYFANVHNRASIDLHARLGFEPVTEDFWYPRARFTGGRGRLFRAAVLSG